MKPRFPLTVKKNKHLGCIATTHCASRKAENMLCFFPFAIGWKARGIKDLVANTVLSTGATSRGQEITVLIEVLPFER